MNDNKVGVIESRQKKKTQTFFYYIVYMNDSLLWFFSIDTQNYFMETELVVGKGTHGKMHIRELVMP